MLPWLVTVLVFAILRQGTVLHIDGQAYEHVLLPKFYLQQYFPWIFKPFWDNAYFQIGTLLPLAVLVCFSLDAVLRTLSRKHRKAVVLTFIAIVAFEYYQPPRLNFANESAQYRWIDWLASEDSQAAMRLINLPMGRDPSKFYGFLQSMNGYPHLEGLASRTPPSAYDYISSNAILKNWRSNKTVNCLPFNDDEFIAAHDQLLGDGFSHIIVHRDRVKGESIAAGFVNIPRRTRTNSSRSTGSRIFTKAATWPLCWVNLLSRISSDSTNL